MKNISLNKRVFTHIMNADIDDNSQYHEYMTTYVFRCFYVTLKYHINEYKIRKHVSK